MESRVEDQAGQRSTVGKYNAPRALIRVKGWSRPRVEKKGPSGSIHRNSKSLGNGLGPKIGTETCSTENLLVVIDV